MWVPDDPQTACSRGRYSSGGLAVFAVSGTQKALDFGLNLIIAPLLGMLTGIGGGIIRDMLVGAVPSVLRSELYAVAALAGALVIVLGHLLGLPPTTMAVAGAALCFGMRFLAIRSVGICLLPVREQPDADAVTPADE